MLWQAKFTYSSRENMLEKKIKIIENKKEKQINAIEDYGKQLIENNMPEPKRWFGTYDIKKSLVIWWWKFGVDITFETKRSI